MTITVRPRGDGYADIELHDGRLITWDFTIPEAEKHARDLRACDHEPTSLTGNGKGGWLCDACGALVEQDKPASWARCDVSAYHSKSAAYADGYAKGWAAAFAATRAHHYPDQSGGTS